MKCWDYAVGMGQEEGNGRGRGYIPHSAGSTMCLGLKSTFNRGFGVQRHSPAADWSDGMLHHLWNGTRTCNLRCDTVTGNGVMVAPGHKEMPRVHCGSVQGGTFKGNWTGCW